MDDTNRGYVAVTDFISPICGADVSDALQKIIDDNPNRTIWFPDGTYLLSKPIATPADPKRSVDLRLSNFAVLKAGDGWNSQEAMVRLGGKDPANDIWTPGSVYSFTGGIVDGSGVAKGISIDSGRETVIRDVSMKRVKIGIHIKRGANNASSDADVSNVNITGTGNPGSIGVLLEGLDNTLTNMRIANTHVGVELCGGGNSLRNIHPLYVANYEDYENSCGFLDHSGANWYHFCYSDHHGIGFRTTGNGGSIYSDCFTMWYAGGKTKHIAFRADGAFNSVVTNLRVGFHGQTPEKILLSAEHGGDGYFNTVFMNASHLTDFTHEKFLQGKILPLG